MDNNEQISNVCEKKGNIGWGVLGFFIPLVGLILFLVWRNDRKEDSKYAGIGALIGFIISTVIPLLFLIFAMSVTFGSFNRVNKYQNESNNKWNEIDNNTNDNVSNNPINNNDLKIESSSKYEVYGDLDEDTGKKDKVFDIEIDSNSDVKITDYQMSDPKTYDGKLVNGKYIVFDFNNKMTDLFTIIDENTIKQSMNKNHVYTKYNSSYINYDKIFNKDLSFTNEYNSCIKSEKDGCAVCEHYSCDYSSFTFKDGEFHFIHKSIFDNEDIDSECNGKFKENNNVIEVSCDFGEMDQGNYNLLKYNDVLIDLNGNGDYQEFLLKKVN